MPRCYYLDLAKVITTFLVIYCHLYSIDSAVRLHFYAFHMPLFFIVSGVFHKYTGKINWSRYCRTILWPIFIFIGLSILSGVLFSGAHLSDYLQCYLIDLLTGKFNDILWFLLALFWCKVILDCVLRFHSFLIPIIILWGCLLFVPVFILKIRLPFVLSQGLMAVPFYIVGFWGKDFLLTRNTSIKWGILCICCLFITVLITALQGRVSMVGVSFGDIGKKLFVENYASIPRWARGLLQIVNIGLFYLNGLIGSLMILSFSLFPFPKMKFVTSLSRSLITVVGTQYLFISPLIRVIGYDNGYLKSACISLCVFALCYLLHLLLQPVYKIVR